MVLKEDVQKELGKGGTEAGWVKKNEQRFLKKGEEGDTKPREKKTLEKGTCWS